MESDSAQYVKHKCRAHRVKKARKNVRRTHVNWTGVENKDDPVRSKW